MPEFDPKRRPENREELQAWYAAALAEQASSGLSVGEYAEVIGVTATTLYQWRRRLTGRVDHKRQRRAPRPAGLVEVTVDRGAIAADDVESFVVRLRGDRRIEVPARFDATELGRLVTVLESC